MEKGFTVIRVRPGSVAAKLLGIATPPERNRPVGFVVTHPLIRKVQNGADQALPEASN
jgi:hypothetical protein